MPPPTQDQSAVASTADGNSLLSVKTFCLDAAAESPPTAPPRRHAARRALSFLLDQWLVLAMGLVILLAHFFPAVGKAGGYIRSEITISYGSVAVIFLLSGLTLPLKKLLEHAVNWRLHLVVQVTSFLVVPAVFFGLAAAIESAGNPAIETTLLVGFVVTACLPTTISSNVVMTRAAGGDDAATMVEVTLGNLLGPFLSPILISRVFLPAVPAFAAHLPPGAHDGLGPLYRRVMQQMGCSVFVPLFVGQVLQALWSDPIKRFMNRWNVGKLGSLALLTIIWSTFCTAFATGTLQASPHPTIVLNLFLNLILCALFSLLAFYLARPPEVLRRLSPAVFRPMSKRETVAVAFCAPAKSQAMGIPLVQAMWAAADDATRARLQIPLVLYTAEGILIAQVLVFFFKRWLAHDDDGARDEEQRTGAPVEPAAAAAEQGEGKP